MENYVRVPEGSVEPTGAVKATKASAPDAGLEKGSALEGASSVLPAGIMRVGEDTLVAERLLTPELARVLRGEAPAGDEPAEGAAAVKGEGAGSASAANPVRIAAFDFDGTVISGNSPVMLVWYLVRRGMLSKSVVARILAWAAAYKCRLPQNESWVRGLVFTAFRGKPVARVNKFLRDFYDQEVSARFRARLQDEMQRHLDAGHVVVCVSATFEPIIAQAMCERPIQFGIATRMREDWQGCYTTEVAGLPVEGEQKVAALTAFANRTFGEGGWVLEWAYGDHHSDRTLLAAATRAYAVTPDRPLLRTARERGYEIIDLEEGKAEHDR